MTTAVLLRGKGKEKKENLQAREYNFLFSCRPLSLPLENKFIFWFNRDAILRDFIFYLNLVADIFGFTCPGPALLSLGLSEFFMKRLCSTCRVQPFEHLFVPELFVCLILCVFLFRIIILCRHYLNMKSIKWVLVSSQSLLE